MPSASGGGLLRLVAGDEPGPWWLRPLRGLSRVASWLYGTGAWLDRESYQRGWRQPGKLDAPVISVGNITVGGTGKTPLTIAVAKTLGDMDRQPAIISRGYGGENNADVAWVWRGGNIVGSAKECGDEPLLMAQRLQIPLAVGPDRHKVGQAVLAEYPQAVLIGDDMFQHHRLHRDLDIVAVDAADPLGGGALLPRGLLRESADQLKRAGLIVQTRAVYAEEAIKSRRMLRRICGPDVPIVAARHLITGFDSTDGSVLNTSEMKDKKAFAFCGLADPEQFHRGLKRLGLNVVGLASFADHYPYRAEDLATIRKKATIAGADCLICSEKDWAKIKDAFGNEMPLFITRLEMKFEDNGQALRRVLADIAE